MWSWDFVFDRTRGAPDQAMVVIDEYTRECLAIHVARRIRGKEAINVFAELMENHCISEYIRSENGSEMVAKKLRSWLGRLGIKTIYIAIAIAAMRIVRMLFISNRSARAASVGYKADGFLQV